jgi:hypothetical protein
MKNSLLSNKLMDFLFLQWPLIISGTKIVSFALKLIS